MEKNRNFCILFYFLSKWYVQVQDYWLICTLCHWLFTSLWLAWLLLNSVALNWSCFISLQSISKTQNGHSNNQFQSDNDTMQSAQFFLNYQRNVFFKSGIKVLNHRWEKCIDTEGDNVEIMQYAYPLILKPLHTRLAAYQSFFVYSDQHRNGKYVCSIFLFWSSVFERQGKKGISVNVFRCSFKQWFYELANEQKRFNLKTSRSQFSQLVVI